MLFGLHEKYGTTRPMLSYKTGGKYHSYSYTEVLRFSARLATGLERLGVAKGARIALLSENRPEWAIVDMAVLALGAIDVPLYPSQASAQIGYILQNSGAEIVFVSNRMQLRKILDVRSETELKHIVIFDPGEEDLPDAVLPLSHVYADEVEVQPSVETYWSKKLDKVTPDDICTVIYTSGTTGEPKGVTLTHNNIVSNVYAALEMLEINDTDSALSFLPLSHVFERTATYALLGAGAPISYAESIERVATNLVETKPTIMCAVPRLFERIHSRILKNVEKSSPIRRKLFHWALNTGLEYHKARREGKSPGALALTYRLADTLVFAKIRARTGGNIRFFVSGGAALAKELGEFFEAAGIIIIEGYGMTESSPIITANSMEGYRFGSVGKPLPGVEVRIAEDGEILTRGPHVMKGYYKDEEATAAIIDEQGWLHTGDIGSIDSDGYLHITDRKKHLFVSSGGKNIAPQPIENLFHGSEFIDQFVLIGDKRMYLTALIYPEMEALKSFAAEQGIPYQTEEELLSHKDVYALVDSEIKRIQGAHSGYERVRKFALLSAPLTIENGELTPTLKVRRKAVEENYRDVIEGMYTAVR